VTTAQDKAGQSLYPGDYIVYGHALGRCAALRFGIVLDIYEANDPYGWWPGKDKGKKKVHLRIRGIDTEGWEVEAKGPKLLTKDSTLQFPDRVVRLTKNQVPAAAHKKLSDYWYAREKEKKS
jgi:hypothetical protein